MARHLMAALVLIGMLGCMPSGGKEYNEGTEELKAKNYDQAIKLFEDALKENPDFAEAQYNLGAAKIQKASKLANDGKDKEALALFREGIKEREKAKKMMDDGKFVATKGEDAQNQLKADAEKELEGVKKFLDNDALLLIAIKAVNKNK